MKSVFWGGKSGCDYCMLFFVIFFFSTVLSVERLFESVGMAQNT